MEGSPDPQFTILEDRSISMDRATVYALVMAGPVTLVQAAAFVLAWGLDALGLGYGLIVNIAAFVGGVLAHELIHGLTWMLFGRLRPRQVKFGFLLKALSPYAHALVPMQARAYKLGAGAPLVLVGLLPYILGLATGHGGLAIFGMLFTLAAGGDMAVLWLLRGVPAGAWVKDHPSRAGCYVVAGPDQPADPDHTPD